MAETRQGKSIAHLDQHIQRLIHTLDLEPHPEAESTGGCVGYYRTFTLSISCCRSPSQVIHYSGETYRSSVTTDGKRSVATVIYFLLEKGGRSNWHAVDADEMWLWHAGSAIDLIGAPSSGKEKPSPMIKLGPDVLAGQTPQHIFKKDEWQSAESNEGWALVSCIVAPGFEFEGFRMASDPKWEPGQ